MDILPGLINLAPEEVENVARQAKKFGLDKVVTAKYRLSKLSAKKPNTYIPDTSDNIIRGEVFVSGKGNSIFFVVLSFQEWFKTSPIVSLEIIEDGKEIKFETENSFYKLSKV